MFIRCLRKPTCAAATIALASSLALFAGCSKQKPAPEEDWSLGTGEVTRVEVTAGGVPTRYQAYFEGKELQRITEVRAIQAREDLGSYTFKGARLMTYEGATIDGRTQARLTFDLQGALTDGRADLTPEEISAITNRAQLLRSLALARKTSDSHGG